MAHVEIEVGDWVRYEDENGEEIISVVTRLDGGGIYTKQTGKYWLTRNEILEVHKKGTP